MNEKKIRLLLVDDDELLKDMYAEVLRGEGFEVMMASDGLEGLDIASKELPEIIFTGIVMPRMDGFAMMENLQKTVMTAKIPVVISSHMGREEDRKKANLLGAKDFIVRNVTPPTEMVRRIKAIVAKPEGNYRLSFESFSLDAQKLAKDMGFSENFHCGACNEKLVIDLKLREDSLKTFEAKFLCPGCGWEAK